MQLTKYIGIPYVIRGEDFSGADCWGLCRLFARHELGLIFPQYMYDIGTNIEEAMQHIKYEQHNLGQRWIRTYEPELGDLCLFRIQSQEVHCGIHLDKKEFLHSLKGRTSAIESFSHVNWTHRYQGSYKWLG